MSKRRPIHAKGYGHVGDEVYPEFYGHWGGKWREDKKERKFLSRRRSIITTINNFAHQHNITVETAANVAIERHFRLNKSLHYLAEHNYQTFE
ncbi:hypothetical protein [Absidia glauca]|uniref:Transcription activator GCR1-like domain-containing protein n=1 Tax=Absidia glauca TaxID=4829 RepID=A0A168Q0E9_ABSGL|nr:hypothetical protein [Absidia glauca]